MAQQSVSNQVTGEYTYLGDKQATPLDGRQEGF
jgi:hypothetical protein